MKGSKKATSSENASLRVPQTTVHTSKGDCTKRPENHVESLLRSLSTSASRIAHEIVTSRGWTAANLIQERGNLDNGDELCGDDLVWVACAELFNQLN